MRERNVKRMESWPGSLLLQLPVSQRKNRTAHLRQQGGESVCEETEGKERRGSEDLMQEAERWWILWKVAKNRNIRPFSVDHTWVQRRDGDC